MHKILAFFAKPSVVLIAFTTKFLDIYKKRDIYEGLFCEEATIVISNIGDLT